MFDPVVNWIGFLEDNPTIFIRGTVAGKEESDKVVGTKVYKVRFSFVVLNFGEEFKINSFCGIGAGHIWGCCEIYTKILG